MKRNILLSLKQAIGCGVAGATGLFLILLGRSTMWEVVVVITVVGGLLCAARQIGNRKFDRQRTIAVLLIVLAAFVLPQIMVGRTVTERADRLMERQIRVETSNSPPWTRVARRIGWFREKFIRSYRSAGSNLDTDVQINGLGDAIRYLPRAVVVGLFAPFPRMWFARGTEVGLTGRLVIGAEMLGLYFLFALASVTVFRERKRLSVWFLFGVSVFGSVALAYVIMNIGALYRIRYPYYLPIILLAASAIAHWSRGSRLLNEAPLT